MKNTIKTILVSALIILSSVFFMKQCLIAWDNTMTDEEIMYYLEKYPNEENLIKLARNRNLIVEDK